MKEIMHQATYIKTMRQTQTNSRNYWLNPPQTIILLFQAVHVQNGLSL